MRPGKLYFSDNLDALRSGDFDSGSVDLIYLDPPFNSQRDYNVLFKERDLSASQAQIKAFDDTWHWDQKTQDTYDELVAVDAVKRGVPQAVSVLVEAFFKSLPKRSDIAAYLVMMTPRLIELHRVLKRTGTMYLHCDPTASHYLKLLLDAVFGPACFLSEVIWKRTGTHSSAKRWGPVHDVILSYAKAPGAHTWNRPYQPLAEHHRKRHYRQVDEQGRAYTHGELTAPGVRHGESGKTWRGFNVSELGRHWCTTVTKLDALDEAGRIYFPPEGGWPRLIRYEDAAKGRAIGDVWDDIAPLNMKAKERLGYPTQKPVALLERIIEASSNPGDVVLDPFCGCGTTIEAAQKLGREWIGIDVTHLAIKVIRDRLANKFPGVKYELLGEPVDVAGAKVLAETSPFQFQWWAVHKVGGHAFGSAPGSREGRRGSDQGIDGIIKFKLDGAVHHVVVSVKGGHTGPAHVRELRGTIEREKAPIGVLITVQEPTAEMKREAASAGSWRPPGSEHRFAKIQLLPVSELFAGKRVELPALPSPTVPERLGENLLLPGMEPAKPPRRRGVLVTVPEKPASSTTPLAPALGERKPAKRSEPRRSVDKKKAE